MGVNFADGSEFSMIWEFCSKLENANSSNNRETTHLLQYVSIIPNLTSIKDSVSTDAKYDNTSDSANHKILL